MLKKKNGQSYYTHRHSCFLLQYHIVLVTKYRKPILTDQIKDSVYSVIQSVCDDKDCNLMELNGEADHVHILVEAGPELSPLELVNVLKTKTARFTRRDYPELVAKWYWKPYLWTDSYFVTTVSENSLSVVQEYIKNQ